jgi:hypothetical protein
VGSPFEWWNIAAHGEPCLRCGWMCWIDLESRCFQCFHEYLEDTWRYSDVEGSWNRGAPQISYLNGMFHEINHPFISIYGKPHILRYIRSKVEATDAFH